MGSDPNANAAPAFADQAPVGSGASPVGQLGDYLLDKTPPPLPPRRRSPFSVGGSLASRG